MLPKEIINIICEFYINNLNSLIIILSIFPNFKYKVISLYTKYLNIFNLKEILCNYIQNNKIDLLKILFINFNFKINSDEFNNICKYSSLPIVKTIYKYNKTELNIYSAIYYSSITFNNDVLKWLYLLL